MHTNAISSRQKIWSDFQVMLINSFRKYAVFYVRVSIHFSLLKLHELGKSTSLHRTSTATTCAVYKYVSIRLRSDVSTVCEDGARRSMYNPFNGVPAERLVYAKCDSVCVSEWVSAHCVYLVLLRVAYNIFTLCNKFATERKCFHICLVFRFCLCPTVCTCFSEATHTHTYTHRIHNKWIGSSTYYSYELKAYPVACNEILFRFCETHKRQNYMTMARYRASEPPPRTPTTNSNMKTVCVE